MKQQKNQLRIGIVLNYVNMGLGNLIPILYTPIMLSILGQSEYGLYKLSSSVTSYLGLISMGLGSAITRYLIKAREQEGKEAEERMLGLFVVIFNIIAAAALILGTVLTMNLDLWYAASLSAVELERMKVLVLLMVCNMALSFSQSPYQSLVTSHEKYLFYQCMNIMLTSITPIMNLVALYLGAASVGMAVVSLVITIIVRICYQVYIRRTMKIKPRFKGMPTDTIKEILAFSFWIFVANIVTQLYNATDTVMIGMIPALATTGVAIYHVGAIFNSIACNLTTGLSSLLAPTTNRLVFSGATTEELTNLAIRIGRLQCYIISLVASGFIAFGRPFLDLYVGSGYENAYWIALFMMIPNSVPVIQSVCLRIIEAQNKHRFRSIVYLTIAIINVVGTWFALHSIGIVGAALVTGLAQIVGQIAMNWFYKTRSNLDIVRFWKAVSRIILVALIPCVCTLLLAQIVDFYNLLRLICGIGSYVLIYVILCWKLAFNKYEKNLCQEMIMQFLRFFIRRQNNG